MICPISPTSYDSHNFPPPWNQQLIPSLIAQGPQSQTATLWLPLPPLSWPMTLTLKARFPVWLLSYPFLVGDHAIVIEKVRQFSALAKEAKSFHGGYPPR